MEAIDIRAKLKEYGFTDSEISENPELTEIIKADFPFIDEKATIKKLKISKIERYLKSLDPAYFRIKLMQEGYSLKKINQNPELIEQRRERMIYEKTKRYRK